MEQRGISYAFVSLIFLLFLSVPLVISITSEDVSVSAAEKRRLASLPELSFSYPVLREFPRKFDKYYQDHFGLRSQMVRLHNYVLGKVFHVSPTSAVVIGDDDWYFLNADGAISDYLGRYHYEEATLDRFKQVLQNRKTWLNSMGAQYIFLPVPNKAYIYEEHLPLRIRRYKGVNKYDQIIGHLKREPLFPDFIDTYNVLIKNKGDGPLYFRTDSHWNHDGAYLVYLEIVKKLQEWFPDIAALRQSTEKQWVENFSGDLATFMNLRGVVAETVPTLNVVQECETKKPRKLKSLLRIPQYQGTETYRLPIITGCSNKKHKAIVIHDSFGNFLKPYLSQHFETIIYINYFNFEKAKTIIELEKPDVVVDLRVQRNLQKALRPDPELEIMLSEQAGRSMTTAMKVSDPKEKEQALPGSAANPFPSLSTAGR